jgi:hypothetical protein
VALTSSVFLLIVGTAFCVMVFVLIGNMFEALLRSNHDAHVRSKQGIVNVAAPLIGQSGHSVLLIFAAATVSFGTFMLKRSNEQA